jgi:hypothetical protein
MSNDLIGPDPLHRTLQQDKEIDHLSWNRCLKSLLIRLALLIPEI